MVCVCSCWVPRSKPLQGEEGHRAPKLECFTLAFGEGCQCVVPSSPQLKWLYIRSVNHGRSHRGCQSLYGNRCSKSDAFKLFFDAQTLVTDAQSFSQYLWPSLVPLMPVLLQPWVPSPAGFEKLSSNSSSLSCRAGPRAPWAPEGFCCASTELCPELRLAPVLMQEGLCSAPQKGSAPLAKRGHCFIFIFSTIENAAC